MEEMKREGKEKEEKKMVMMKMVIMIIIKGNELRIIREKGVLVTLRCLRSK